MTLFNKNPNHEAMEFVRRQDIQFSTKLICVGVRLARMFVYTLDGGKIVGSLLRSAFEERQRPPSTRLGTFFAAVHPT